MGSLQGICYDDATMATLVAWPLVDDFRLSGDVVVAHMSGVVTR